MKYTIYLVGQISTEDERTYQWRENVKDFFEEQDNFSIIDPCSNPFNQGKLKKDVYEVYKTNGIGILPTKDRGYVKSSDIAIANMYQYDKNKPLIGSCYELAWYMEDLSKTVIGVHPETKNSNYCNHPFIKKSVNCWVKNELDACEMIMYYFKDI